MKTLNHLFITFFTLFFCVTIFAQKTPKAPKSALNPGVTNSSIVSKNLKIINDTFKKYNTYKATFSVRGSKIYLDNSVSNFSADLNDVIFYVNYENKWMVLKCIKDGCFEGTTFEDEYSMSLKTSNGDICPNIDDVLEAFNSIRSDVLRRQ